MAPRCCGEELKWLPQGITSRVRVGMVWQGASKVFWKGLGGLAWLPRGIGGGDGKEIA